eukprot:146824_1
MKVINSRLIHFIRTFKALFLVVSVTTSIWSFYYEIHFFRSSFDPYQVLITHPQNAQYEMEEAHDDNKVHILLCSDANDKLPLYTVINSIIQNEQQVDRLYFHILVYSDIPVFMQEFTDIFGPFLHQIQFEFKSIVDDIPECIEYSDVASTTLPAKQQRNWLNNIMNFARFCMPKVFRNVKIGVYLDVDMIVQSSISSLYDDYYYEHEFTAWSVMNRSPYKRTFKNKDRAAFVNNYLNHNLSIRYPSVAATPINLSAIEHMFNGGILMFDLNVWRRNHFTEQSIELFKFNKLYTKEFNKKPWTGVTQPILNMLFVINQIPVGNLGKIWNFVIKDLIPVRQCEKPISKRYKMILNRANIVHWAGGCKPWTSSNVSTDYIWKKYIPDKVENIVK